MRNIRFITFFKIIFCGNHRSHLFWDQHTANFGAIDAPILDFGHKAANMI